MFWAVVLGGVAVVVAARLAFTLWTLSGDPGPADHDDEGDVSGWGTR